jgi:hypothetical protein
MIMQYSISGGGSFRLFKVETKTQKSVSPIGAEPSHNVYRRYKDFEWLSIILKCRFPSCIIPPIPPKNALVNWYNDESEQIVKRK